MQFVKKFSVSLLLLLLLSFFSFYSLSPSTPHVYAKSMTIDCYTLDSCTANQRWPGSVHGGESFFTVSNPGISSSDLYMRFIVLYAASNCGQCYTVEVGIDKGGACSTDTVYYFYNVFSGNGNQFIKCFKADSTDINSNTTFGASYYVSNGGGTFIWITNTFGGNDVCNPCALPTGSLGQTFSEIDLFERFEGLVSGHAVWGSTWDNNEWQGLNGSWNYQGNLGSGISADNPVQMFWNAPPKGGSNNGGKLVSCVYETGKTCTIGK